jgi:aldose 1-epimerase
LNADAFTPIDPALIPTGEIRDVDQTPMDFRTRSAIGARIDDAYDQLSFAGGYDHNFVLNDFSGLVRRAANVYEPESGRTLEVLTTQPGVQFYSGNFFDGTIKGKGGVAYEKRSGFCLETQHFPDSPNHPQFPTTVLEPGDVFRQTTVFRFGVE